MYKSILVPLDGSAFGEHALPIARSIASRSGAAFQLVRVHEPVVVDYANGVEVFDDKLEARNREQEKAYLDEIVERLALSPNVSVTTKILDKLGAIAETLLSQIKDTNVDLVVMATHGHGALARFWLGSVADKLVRQAETPILLVRPQEGTPDLIQEKAFKHILIPLDGSDLAEQVLEYAIALGKMTQADYTLLRIVELMLPVNYTPDYATVVDQQLLDILQVDAQTYLDKMADRLRAQSLQVQTRIVFNHQPAIAVLEEASKHGTDLITMATHGQGGLTRLLVGSTADKVIRGATIPVLVYRPQGETS
jgi:nucleotide-binding universal stress UspA family protein